MKSAEARAKSNEVNYPPTAEPMGWASSPDHLLNDHHKTHLFKEFLKEWQ